MPATKRLFVTTPFLAALLFTGSAVAQHEGHAGHSQRAAAKTPTRVGDPYPFATCPISGKKLGSMGDPAVKVYDGREVRFCCSGCTPKFEKVLQQSLGKIDAKIAVDQASLYPLKTSVVTGKGLPEKPYEFVHGNRLIRLGSAKERAEFDRNPAKFLSALDEAVVDAQGKNYALKKCPVSGDPYGDGVDRPVDLILAGRLVRVGCKNCLEDVEKDPARFIGLIDAARHSGKTEGEHAPDGKDEHGKQHGKGSCCK